MKRFTTYTVITLALFLLFTVSAFAVDPAPGTNTELPSFIDEDGDGICDNYQAGGRGLGLRNGTGANFVDADGNGVCDNAGTGVGRANRAGKGLRNGTGANFVDADGNGVCDNAGASTGKATRGGKGIASLPGCMTCSKAVLVPRLAMITTVSWSSKGAHPMWPASVANIPSTVHAWRQRTSGKREKRKG